MGQKAKQEKRKALETRAAARHDESRVGRTKKATACNALNNAAQDQNESATSSLPYIEGMTLDKQGTNLRDDGFAIRKTADGWQLQVCIVDMPSHIADGSALEQEASRLRTDKKAADGNVQRIFPYELLRHKASFKPGAKNPAIAFDISLDNELNVTGSRIYRAIFMNHDSYSFDVADDRARTEPQLAQLFDLGHSLYQKRIEDTILSAKRELGIGNAEKAQPAERNFGVQKSKRLVLEITHLANKVAANYLYTNKLAAPFMRKYPEIEIVHVSPFCDFDRQTNILTDKVARAMTGDLNANIRVTSPMRNYNEFLGLKIIGAHLDGSEVSTFTNQMTKSLSAEFQKKADVKSRLLGPSWNRQWQSEFKRQACGIALPAEKTGAELFMDLRDDCFDADLPEPMIVMRKIGTEHITLHLVGIDSNTEVGAVQIWGVGHRVSDAMTMACSQFRRQCMPANTSVKQIQPGMELK